MPNEELATTFSRRLRRLIAERGLTPKSLCWLMGDTEDRRNKVLKWMNGESLPMYESLLLLHRALNCSWEELFGE